MELEITVHLAVAGGVFLVLSFFPRDVLDEILDLIESVSGFFSYLVLDSVHSTFSFHEYFQIN